MINEKRIKVVFTILFYPLLVLLVISCKDEDHNAETIVGTWTEISDKEDCDDSSNDSTEICDDDCAIWTFSSDGSLTITTTSSLDGSYRIEADVLEICFGPNNVLVCIEGTCSFSGSRLKLTFRDDDDGCDQEAVFERS